MPRTVLAHQIIGTVLFALTVAAAVIGFRLWAEESDRADRVELRNDLRRAVSADQGVYLEPDDETPDRALAIGAFAVGGVLFLSGVIVFATTPSRTP